MDSCDPNVWSAINKLYGKALHSKGQKMKPDRKSDLIKLDKWFQTELPDVICSKEPKHITREELCKLMKWKLTRGKFRPRLTELVQTNTEEEVIKVSTEAFKLLPDVAAAVNMLSVLKAVGPATASAVLAAGAPEHVAFMADESILALPGLQPIKYDLPFYTMYMAQITNIVKKLNKQDPESSWTPHKVELTLWTYYIAKTLDPDLYKTIEMIIEPEAGTPPIKKRKM